MLDRLLQVNDGILVAKAKGNQHTSVSSSPTEFEAPAYVRTVNYASAL